jgi:putative membrane protein insertion efficiency factor
MIGRLLLRAIGFYSRAISPALPARCRFYPTCSAYAAEAITRHGAARGSWLALRRLVKCAPWHPGGVDLVPAAGTVGAGHSSSTSAGALPPAHAPHRGEHTTEPATPPAFRPASQEESSVA